MSNAPIQHPMLEDIQRKLQESERRCTRLEETVSALAWMAPIGKPAWMAPVGKAVYLLTSTLFYLECNIWYLVMALAWRDHLGTCGGTWRGRPSANAIEVLRGGTYNPKYARWVVIMNGGAFLNSVALLCAMHFVAGRDDLLPICASNVAFCASMFFLTSSAIRVALRAGTGWERARDSFRARLFRAFGVAVDEVKAPKTAVPLYVLVSMLPAVLTGFCAGWFAQPQLVSRCGTGAGWMRGEQGVAFCSSASVCCRVVDQRSEFFIFVAYLAGNALAAYYGIKYSAMCLLARAQLKGHVTGGTGITVDTAADLNLSLNSSSAAV